MRAAWAVLGGVLLALPGCASDDDLGFAVAVSLSFDGSISDDALLRLHQLRIVAGGDESFSTTLLLDHVVARSERFVYRPQAQTRRLSLAVDAQDGTAMTLATGRSAEIQLSAGQTATLQITLFSGGGVDMGPPGCSGRSVALCEDFDNGLGTAWNTQTRLGTAMIDETHAHSGTHALRAHTNAVTAMTDSPVALIFEGQTLTTPNQSFHLRAYYYLTASASPLGLPIAIATVLQSVAGARGVTLELNGGHFGFIDGITSGTLVGAGAIPFDRWACLEWTFTAGAPGAVSLSVDGVPVSDIEMHDTTTIDPPLSQLAIGLAYANLLGTVPAIDIWIDDILFDAAPIGCD